MSASRIADDVAREIGHTVRFACGCAATGVALAAVVAWWGWL